MVIMKSVNRKIIFECHVGSKLYGTNRPDSDDDFMGVFLPSTKESFGLNPFSRENSELDMGKKISESKRNTVGDLDKKYYRIDKFLTLLSEGQSKLLEMLFSPKELWTNQSPEWDLIYSNRDLFLSKNAIIPFCSFAKAQSLKAVLKGDNLNTLRELIALLESKNKNKTIKEELSKELDELNSLKKIKLLILKDGVDGVEIAGRKYLLSQKVKDVYRKLSDLEKEYGDRSKKSAEEGYDFKSLSHAYRLLFQSEFLLKNNTLMFPLPKEQIDFLKKVRSGEYKADYFSELDQMQEKVMDLKEKSTLADSVDLEKVEDLCQKILYNHLIKK